MFEKSLYPKVLQPKLLDALLEKGWFRMGQSIYTTHYTLFQMRVYPTIWLRHVLADYKETSTIHKLKKRNADFWIELKEAEITPAHEQLFDLYKSMITFSAADSLYQLLYGYVYRPTVIFRTYELNMYHDDRLIACSYFDTGHKSAEGISAYYHPDYKQYSPGKFLIYQQIETCIQNGFELYYPGYFVPGYPHLDYKLHIGSECLEFFDPQLSQWKPFSEYEDRGVPLEMASFFYS